MYFFDEVESQKGLRETFFFDSEQFNNKKVTFEGAGAVYR